MEVRRNQVYERQHAQPAQYVHRPPAANNKQELIDQNRDHQNIDNRNERQFRDDRQRDLRHLDQRNWYRTCAMGAPRTSMRDKSADPTPSASASSKVLSHVSNGLVPRFAREPYPLTAVPTVSVPTALVPMINTPGFTYFNPGIHGPSPPVT